MSNSSRILLLSRVFR